MQVKALRKSKLEAFSSRPDFKLGACFLFCLALIFSVIPSLPASEVFIPRDLASVRNRTEGTNGKTIVIIEEAHVDYAAQKALAEILKDLIENESLHDVLVEGGWGDVTLTGFKGLADPERRKVVAEAYLREGKLSGEEYLNLSTDLDMRILGVEDPKLYEANMNVFLKISEVRPGLLAALARLDAQLKNLRVKALTPAMNELLDRRADFDGQKISLLDYIQYLMKQLPGAGKRFPNLAQITALSGGDGSYDPDKIAPEKESAIRFLSQQLAKPELEEILFLKEQKTTGGELYFLETLFTKVRSFPEARRELSLKNLHVYKNILQKTVSMNIASIFTEIEQAEQETMSAQKLLPEQQALLEMIRGVQYLGKLFDLRLTVEEFQAQSIKPGLEAWNDVLKKACEKYGVSYQPFNAAEFEQYISAARAFYDTAVLREDAMAKNTLARIDESGANLCALITGGFHSQNLFKVFKEQGYTVMLVSPRFTPSADSKSQHEQYLNILKYKWTGETSVQSSKFEVLSAKTH